MDTCKMQVMHKFVLVYIAVGSANFKNSHLKFQLKKIMYFFLSTACNRLIFIKNDNFLLHRYSR
jgi:uncharacterized membrane protein SirB2